MQSIDFKKCLIGAGISTGADYFLDRGQESMTTSAMLGAGTVAVTDLAQNYLAVPGAMGDALVGGMAYMMLQKYVMGNEYESMTSLLIKGAALNYAACMADQWTDGNGIFSTSGTLGALKPGSHTNQRTGISLA